MSEERSPDVPVAVPVVDKTRCTGCGRCVAACRTRLLTLEVIGYRKHALLSDELRCTGCHHCMVACPAGALTTPQ